MVYLKLKTRESNVAVIFICLTMLFMVIVQSGYSQEENFMKDWPRTQEILDAYNNGQRASAENDYSLAAQYYRNAAEKGFPPAQLKIGHLYLNGKGVEFNLKEGFRWIKLSAEAGWPFAFTPLAYMYYEGLGAIKNIEEAIKWYFKGAEWGNSEAQFCLGLAYDNGEGVAQDHVEAAKWYEKAAKQGHAGAANNLSYTYLRGIVKPLTSNEDGMFWLIKAADMGDMTAQYTLGLRYMEGVGVPQNKAKALELFHKSAEQGFLKAQMAIAEIEANQ